MGNDIYGVAPYDQLDEVSLSSDGLVLATGSNWNDSAGTDAGHVRVFKYDGTSWIQVGQAIEGLASNNKTPTKGMKISSDGSTVILGNHYYSSNRGIVRVFSIPKVNGVWNQIGSPIYGESAGDNFGFGLSLSYDGSIVAYLQQELTTKEVIVVKLEYLKIRMVNWTQMGQTLME